jgi:signal transduction histidine kinase
VEAVRRSADHLLRLIDQVITFARLEGGHERLQLGPVDVPRLVGDIATLTRPLADRKGLSLELNMPASPPTLVSDEKKISQILVSLVTNAIKYTDHGGIHVEVDSLDGEVVLRVRDAGPGIPPDKTTEIFEPFRQLEDPRTRREGGAAARTHRRLIETEALLSLANELLADVSSGVSACARYASLSS